MQSMYIDAFLDRDFDKIFKEGLEEGLEAGKIEARHEVAGNLFTEGSTPHYVHEITGLSLDEIEKLQEQGN